MITCLVQKSTIHTLLHAVDPLTNTKDISLEFILYSVFKLWPTPKRLERWLKPHVAHELSLTWPLSSVPERQKGSTSTKRYPNLTRGKMGIHHWGLALFVYQSTYILAHILADDLTSFWNVRNSYPLTALCQFQAVGMIQTEINEGHLQHLLGLSCSWTVLLGA